MFSPSLTCTIIILGFLDFVNYDLAARLGRVIDMVEKMLSLPAFRK